MEDPNKENLIYDAENAPVEEKNENLVYDYEEEIEKKEAALNLPEQPEDTEEPYMIDENSENVFTNGLNGGKFIVNHHCPVCMFTKKNILELYSKRRFSREKHVAGYMATCANCGHVDLYTDNPQALMKYLQGKAR